MPLSGAAPDPRTSSGAPAGSDLHGPLGAHLSPWQAHARPDAFPALDRDLDTDVLVVGAGITGLTTAAFLQHGGARVAVVEAREVGAGVTGRSTGHLTELVDGRYASIEKDHGKEAAVLVRTAARGGIEDVRRLAERYAPGAGYARVPAYLYPATARDADAVDREAEAAVRAGCHATLVETVPLPFPVSGGLVVGDQAQFDPLAFVQGLARGLAAEGVGIYERTRVTGVDDGEPVRVETEHGHTVTARRVVLATHSPLGFSPLQTVAHPYRSYVLAFHLPGGQYPEGLFFDSADPYVYLRTAELGGERVLLVGGADHKTGEGGADDAPYRQLLDYTLARLPDAVVRYRYSAEVLEPTDGLPFIGRSPLHRHVYVGTGYGGDGLLWGAVAGRVLADLARDVESPYEATFRPTRLRLAGTVDFVKENLDAAYRFVADRFATDVERPEDLLPGQGGLVQAGGDHLAVYRDDDGALHALSPVCPHLGCVVRWNGADQTWDCPCHGSRFAAATGEVLHGPATARLPARTIPPER